MGLRSTPLKSFFKCRSTRWWQSTQAKGTKDDPCNHTRWKQRWAWHNRGCVWDKIATDWACKTDWMSERKKFFSLTDTTIIATFTLECVKVSGKKVDGGQSSKRVKKVPQCSCVGTERWRVNGSMVSILWDSRQRKIGQIQRKRCCHGGKRKIDNSILKNDDYVKHIFRKHDQEADHRANLGAVGQENYC